MRKLTNEQFANIISSKIILLEKYQSSTTRISVKCRVCHYIWFPKARNLIRGFGCPECGKRKAKETTKWHISQDQFLKKIPDNLKKYIEVCGEYKHQHCKINVRCKICGRKWLSTPHYLYRGQGCEKCGRARKGLASRKTHDVFVKEVKSIHSDAIEVVGQYKTGVDRIGVKCRLCGHFWTPVAHRLLRRGCPKCYGSKGENKIEKILLEAGVKFKREYVFDDLRGKLGGRLRFDFAILDGIKLKYLIEYDGQQHFVPLKHTGGQQRFDQQLTNDKIKNDYCKKHQIKLIRIPYTEFKNINLSMLGINT
jgi:predicted  nucleic acid-binding Zn-ribbon protein